MQYNIDLLRQQRLVIGQNIHQLRIKKKLTLRKLARLSNLPEYLLDQYELGKNEIRLYHLFRIACVLEVGPEKLVMKNSTNTIDLDEKFWRYFKLPKPKNIGDFTLWLDEEILSWFKKQGAGYQTLMNSVLKAYVESRRGS